MDDVTVTGPVVQATVRVDASGGPVVQVPAQALLSTLSELAASISEVQAGLDTKNRLLESQTETLATQAKTSKRNSLFANVALLLLLLIVGFGIPVIISNQRTGHKTLNSTAGLTKTINDLLDPTTKKGKAAAAQQADAVKDLARCIAMHIDFKAGESPTDCALLAP